MNYMEPPTTLPSDIRGLASGAEAWASGFLSGLRPDPDMTVSEWADARRVIAPESSPFPGQWRTDRTPYLREVMDCLSPSHPAKVVTVMKGAQLGFTDALINFALAIADIYPGPAMLVSPTVDLARALGREKLDPAIRETPAVRRKIRASKSRSADGSTTMFKRFPGGFLVMTGANSSAGLQQRSIKYLLKEELSEWPYEADKRGDPSDMADKRTTAFSDECKIFQPSTPNIEGQCRISEAYERSDKRRFYLPCPHCGHEQVLELERLRYSEEYPHGAEYECAGPDCGVLIQHHEKRAMLALGRWIAEAPGPGRQPGFHISQLYSPFVGWDDIAAEWIVAEGNPRKEKSFSQQVLGLPYKETGEAPEAELLMERREDYALQTVPLGGLVLTAGVDVQGDHFVYEVVAWGIGKTSWSIDYGKIQVGDTGDPGNWSVLADLLGRRYPDFRGAPQKIALMAVDSGYRTHIAYAFARAHGNVIAVKGDRLATGGDRRASIGKPRKVDLDYEGRVVKKGAEFYMVGTWVLKGEFYAYLRLTPPEDGDEVYRPGYCHYSLAHTQDFFEEQTAEYLSKTTERGRDVMRWIKARADNHFLDCRIYAAAALDKLGADRWTQDDWRALAADREVEKEVQGDLEAYARQMQPTTPDEASPPAAAQPKRRHRRAQRSRFMDG